MKKFNLTKQIISLFLTSVFFLSSIFSILAMPLPDFGECLKCGDSGYTVVVLKNMLLEARDGPNAEFPPNAAPHFDVFDTTTQREVQEFQRSSRLQPTGVADTATINALRTQLEHVGILNTPENVEIFLRRVQRRCPSGSGSFFGAIANGFRRINWIDLAVTAGITATSVAAATLVGMVCPPAAPGAAFATKAVVGMVLSGSAIGAVANGTSEYIQQDGKVDRTRACSHK